jgi:hypothetical protein
VNKHKYQFKNSWKNDDANVIVEFDGGFLGGLGGGGKLALVSKTRLV